MNIAENSTIRDYRVIRKIGEGGMGMVYLAEDTMLERQVAIKILNPLLTKDPQFIERFRSEAKVQSRLVHPHIATLHTFFVEEGSYCIVMEYAAGQTLKNLIENLGRMPEEKALKVFDQILQAVGYAHSRGIIHRDLKPSNVIVDSYDQVKVMDFGIAKIVGEKGMTRTGAKVGTLFYMSPEQVRAQKDIDQKSDIYSLAIMLYEMLSGHLPYSTDTESDFEVMQEIVERELPPLQSTAPEVSRTTEAALVVAAAKDREARFKDCQAFQSALGGILPARTPLRAAPTSMPLQGASARTTAHVPAYPPKAGVPFNPDADLAGVQGWLLLFCIILTVLVPLQVFIGAVNFQDGVKLWDRFTDNNTEEVYLPVRLQMIVMAGLALWGIFIGVDLWRRVAGAVQRTRRYLKVNMILSILAGFIPLLFISIRTSRIDDVFRVLLLGAFTNILYYGICNSYFAKSKRVANTYRESDLPQPTAPSALAWEKQTPAPAPLLTAAELAMGRLGSKSDFPPFIRNRIPLIIFAVAVLAWSFLKGAFSGFSIGFSPFFMLFFWLMAELVLSGRFINVDRTQARFLYAGLGITAVLVFLPALYLMNGSGSYSFLHEMQLFSALVMMTVGALLFVLTGSALQRERQADTVFRRIFKHKLFNGRAVWVYGALYFGMAGILLVNSLLTYNHDTRYLFLLALPQIGLVVLLQNLLASEVKNDRWIAILGVAAALAGIVAIPALLLGKFGSYGSIIFFISGWTLFSALWLIWLGFAMLSSDAAPGYISLPTLLAGLVFLASQSSFLGRILEIESSGLSQILLGTQCLWALLLLFFVLKKRQMEGGSVLSVD